MHALNRRDYIIPVIVGNYLRRLVGNEPGGRAMMPCIFLALPDPALPFMAAVPDAGKRSGDRPRRTAAAVVDTESGAAGGSGLLHPSEERLKPQHYGCKIA